MGPPRCFKVVYLMSSVWVPSSSATKKCRKSHRWTQEEREKARPRLGPQQLPTKAFTMSAPLCHSAPQSRQQEIDRSLQDRTWPPVRGSVEAKRREEATPYQSGIRSLTAIYNTFFFPPGFCFRFGGESISARASQSCQVSSESGELTETNIYPSDCRFSSCSPPDPSVPPFTSYIQTTRDHRLLRKVS